MALAWAVVLPSGDEYERGPDSILGVFERLDDAETWAKNWLWEQLEDHTDEITVRPDIEEVEYHAAGARLAPQPVP